VLAALAFWGLPALIGVLLGDTLLSPIPDYIWISVAALVGLGWITGIGEETGWCAYALPRLSPAGGKTRAAIVSSVIRGLWHWPVMVSPVIAQVAAGERTPLELAGAGVVIALVLIISNLYFGPIFCWLWYRTESIPLTGWLHYWYDLVRDVAVMLLVGFGSSLWMTSLSGFVLLPVGFMLLSTILADEGLDWKQFLGIGRKTQPR
jgi:membrane protease YdiL (CAAX protease family)